MVLNIPSLLREVSATGWLMHVVGAPPSPVLLSGERVAVFPARKSCAYDFPVLQHRRSVRRDLDLIGECESKAVARSASRQKIEVVEDAVDDEIEDVKVFDESWLLLAI